MTPRKTIPLALVLFALPLFALGSSQAGAQTYAAGPCHEIDRREGVFWDQVAIVLGDATSVKRHVVTLHVLDQVTAGDPVPESVSFTFPHRDRPDGCKCDDIQTRGWIHRDRFPQSGKRYFIPLVRKGKEFDLACRASLWEELPFPLETDATSLEAVRRIQRLTPRGYDPGTFPEIVRGLSDDEPSVRIFCFHILKWTLIQEPDTIETRVGKFGLSEESLLEAVFEMATGRARTPRERAIAARFLACGRPYSPAYRVEEAIASLSELALDDQVDVNLRFGCLLDLVLYHPRRAVPVGLELLARRTDDADLRTEALVQLGGVGDHGPVYGKDLGHKDVWREEALRVYGVFLGILADDPNAMVRRVAASTIAERLRSKAWPPEVKSAMNKREIEEILDKEKDEDVRKAIRELLSYLDS